MTQTLPIQFLTLNEGDDPKSLQAGTMTRNWNCRMDKGRRLAKRFGTNGLVKTALSGSNIAAGKRLLQRDTGLAITDGATAWAYSDALTKWGPVDRPPSWQATKRTLIDSTRSVVAVDCAISGSLLVTLYQTQKGTSGLQMVTGGLFVKVEDLTSGQVLLPPLMLASDNAAYPRALINGSTAILIHSDTSAILYNTLDLSTLTQGSGGALALDSRTANSVFDAVIGTPSGGVPTLYLAYELDSGTNRMNVASFDATTFVAVANTAVLGTDVRTCCLAFCDTAQRIALAFSFGAGGGSTGTKLLTCTTSLTSASTGTVYSGTSDYVFVAEDNATNVLYGWTRNDNNSGDADRLTTALYAISGHAQVAVSERITFGLTAVSKPWKTAGRWFTSAVTWVHPYDTSSTAALAQPSSVVIEVETANSLTGVQDATHPHVGTLENQTGWYPPIIQITIGADLNTFLVKPVADSDGNVWVPATFRDREPTEGILAQLPVGWSLFKLSAAAGDTFRSAQIGVGSLCAGAAPCWNDGATLMPYGFAHAPQIISVTKGSGGAIVAGTYSYVATYAWRDANGVLHRSAPSNPMTGTTETTNLKLTVKVSTSSLSAKQRALTAANSANPIMVELWRTTIGGTGPHYRLTLEPTYQVLLNDPRAGDVSFADTKADANIAASGSSPSVTLATQDQLYTDDGELENEPPPSFTTCITHVGRLAGIGPDQRTVWLSKDARLDPLVAPGFHEELTVPFASDKFALASLDEKLIVFGENTIDVVQGDGPDASGNGGWSVQGVQTDAGCPYPRSIVASALGVMFMDAAGRLMLLDRGLSVTWIGNDVDETFTTYPNVTSAVLVPNESEIRFTCNAADGTTGVIVVYDYMYKTWFVRHYNDASDTAADSIPFVDAALIDGVYTLLTANGQVYRETDAHFLDGSNEGSWVTRDIILAHISPGGPVSWSRVKDVSLLGTSVTNHDLEVSFARDYAASYETTRTFLAGTLVTAIGPLERARIGVKHQKCQALQIRIRDLTPTNPGTYAVTTGEGPIIEGLALRVGVKGVPLPAAGQEG